MLKTSKKDLFLVLIIVLFFSFMLNFVWEKTHVVLYKDYSDFVAKFFIPVSIYTAFIDTILVLIIYFLNAVIFQDFLWVKRINYFNILITGIFGIFIATFIEQRALNLGKWAYTDSMPILPILNVGLSPVLQMILLPVIIFYLANIIVKKYEF